MGGFVQRRRTFVLFVGVVLVAVAASSAIGAAKLTRATSEAGRSITAVRTASDAGQFVTNSTTYVDVPGAAATINVARGRALIVIRFTSSTFCDLDMGGSRCLVRAQVNGTDAPPGGIVFDGVTPLQDRTPAAHAMDWSSGPVPAGSYAVQLQIAISPTSPGFFYLRGWHLTVERVRV
jgi:hypothetical protein